MSQQFFSSLFQDIKLFHRPPTDHRSCGQKCFNKRIILPPVKTTHAWGKCGTRSWIQIIWGGCTTLNTLWARARLSRATLQEQQENCRRLKSKAGELDKSSQKVIKDEEEGATVRWWRWVTGNNSKTASGFNHVLELFFRRLFPPRSHQVMDQDQKCDEVLTGHPVKGDTGNMHPSIRQRASQSACWQPRWQL